MSRFSRAVSDPPTRKEADGWLFAVLQNQLKPNRSLQMLATLENLRDRAAVADGHLQQIYPREMWLEVKPRLEGARSPLTSKPWSRLAEHAAGAQGGGEVGLGKARWRWTRRRPVHPPASPGVAAWMASACTPPFSSATSVSLTMRWRSRRLFPWNTSATIYTLK